jgi:hypothetical protein
MCFTTGQMVYADAMDEEEEGEEGESESGDGFGEED